MARYDIESDVQFAEKRFAEARAYREKVAKEQDDFAKKLLGLKGVVEGVNLMVNNAADEMERKQLPKKASYDVLNARSESIRNEEAARISSGLSVQDFLENKYFTQLSQEASQTFSQLSPAQYTKALRAEAAKLATNNVSSYESLVKAANNIPDFENFDEFYKENSNMPRSIAGWIGNKAKSFLKKETPETLKIKNEKASDALYGTALFKNYKNLETQLIAFDTVTSKGIDAVKIINNLNLKTGGLNANASKMETKPIIDEPNGLKKEITIFYGATNKLDGTGVEFRPENIVVLDERISKIDDNLATLTEVNNLYTLADKEHHAKLSDILSSTEGRPTFAQYQKAREYLATNQAYAINWQDEAAKERAFPTWFSSQIIGVRASDGKLIARDLDMDGVYEINPKYMDEARKLGLDEQTLKQKYNKLGSEANNQTLTPDDLVIRNTTDLLTEVPEEFKNDYEELLTDINSDFYEIMKPKLKENEDENVVKLGQYNLQILFPNLGLKGVKTIYFDREQRKVYFGK